MKKTKKEKKNFFWVIYSPDAAALPVSYCDNYAELCSFFNKTKLQMSSALNKHNNDPKYKTGFIRVTGTTKKYSVSCFYAVSDNQVTKIY